MPRSDVAIVGMACRFPQAPDLDAFWNNILSARVCFSEVPRDRWNHELFYHPGAREIDKTYVRKGGFVDDIWSFPAIHMGIPPLRMKATDPQHRILLEAVRGAFADAGLERRPFNRSRTGVFVGASVSEHKDLQTSRLRAVQMADGQLGGTIDAETALASVESVSPIRSFAIAGNLLNMMAATVAQELNLGGPAFAIDAACSSALVATYEAVAYLRAGTCDVAVAGGVYLILQPDNMVGFSRIGAISKNDACRPFDAAADGFVLGEGVGAVILKRLDDALRDGDRIYAVIRGAGINNDGRGDGPMTPRQGGQVDVLARAYEDGGITPDTVGYIEAHGTATGVGDVVEIAALGEYYGRAAAGPVDAVVSSVKANIGHTMSAAGVAGLIKAALVLHERTIPPQAAFDQLNPAVDLGGRFRVATAREPWLTTGGKPRRAAVSSFGFGGTNCHLVLEEAPPAETVADAPFAFVISAPTPALLDRHLGELLVAVSSGLSARASLGEIAATLAARKREDAAVGFVARDREELLRRFGEARRALAGEPVAGIWASAAPRPAAERKVAFLFPGQGTQAVGLCRALHDRFPRFRARLEALSGQLLPYLYPPEPFDREAAERELTRTEICQPIMAALGIALADLLADFGVVPDLVAGHSLGEIAAAGAVGLLGAGEAVAFVAERGRIIAGLPLADAGAMAAISATRERIAPHAAEVPGIVLANVNHPTQVVASGTTAGIEALVARLAAAGIAATRLPVSHAFHSPLMEPAAAPLAEAVARLTLGTPRVPVVSCIEPGVYPTGDAARAILVRHLTAPVLFADGVLACAAAGATIWVQAGAGNALLSMARATLPAPAAALVATAAAKGDDTSRFCEALAELAVAGLPVDLRPLAPGAGTWLPPTPLPVEVYRVVDDTKKEPRPTMAQAALPSSQPAAPPSGLVELFREQMAVLAAHAEIIRRQTEALTGVPAPIAATRLPAPAPVTVGPAPVTAAPAAATLTAAAAPAPAPAAPTTDAAVETKLLDLVSQVSAYPRAKLDLDKRLSADLGFDSLMVVELAGKLADAFPAAGTLPKSLFVNDPPLRRLAAHTAGAAAGKNGRAAVPGAAPAQEIRRYAVELVPQPLAPLPAGLEAALEGPVVIVTDRTDRGGAGARLAALLEAAGIAASTATTVPAVAPTIVDLRALDAGSDDARAPALAAFQLARGVAPRRPSTVLFAHRGLSGAGLPGLARALAREWSATRVKSLRIDDGDAAAAIFAELRSSDATVEIVHGAGGRQVPRFVPAPLGAATPLRQGAVVAISGGARGLGAKLAVELGRRAGARVILLGRAPSAAETVAAVEAAGGRARYVQADVTDAAAVAAALAEGRRVFGPIEAVVHCAGVLADAPVERKRDEDFLRVFDTKVAGALALDHATAGDPVRAFLLFGSWAGRVGNAHQTDYAAASGALAALAASIGAHRPSCRAAVLDLPPWEGSDMARTIPAPVADAMRARGVPFLTDETGLPHVLAELLAEGAGGEVLLGGAAAPVERGETLAVPLSTASHPWLDDHRIEGHPVLPLAAAAGLALAVADRVAPDRRHQLVRLELEGGVILPGDGAERVVVARASVGQGPIEIELSVRGERGTAYTATAEPLAGPAPELQAPAGQAPALSVADFYARHIFHGPRLRGIVRVDAVSDRHVAGVVRSAAAGEIAGHHAIDPLFLDSCFQLAGYWALVKHGRAGLPLGVDELRLLAPIPAGAELHCLLVFEQAQGDLYSGAIDVRDAAGKLLLQIRGARAELRAVAAQADDGIDPSNYRVEEFPAYKELRQRLDMAQAMGIANPYFNLHERVTADTSLIGGREMLNYSSYNYLGLSGDEDVARAVGEAVARYGTSVSASRVASGEKPLHRELEAELARFLGTEDAILYVGGHATNVVTIGHLFGPGDLIVHDSLAHDSILGGAKLSGARRRPFPHNDWRALDELLAGSRKDFKKVLIAVEGTYSMDGDIPPLPELIRVKKKHKAMMLVDEAHSLGVVGATGRGVGEHHGVDRRDVELWMGTLSKSLSSCGGYIASSRATVEYLKYTAPGFVYSVGISPPNAASALASLRKLEAHPELVETLRARSRFFLELLRARGIDTGMSEGTAVIPCIVGNSWDCLQLSQALGRRGINVQPILYPAVEEHLARLRFFMTARHTEAQLTQTADILQEELMAINPAHLQRRRLAVVEVGAGSAG